MQLIEDQRCRLLFAVYPTFVEALPTVSQSEWNSFLNTNQNKVDGPVTIPPNAVLSQDNFITQMRDEIKKIGITFNKADDACRELDDDPFQDARDALQQILFLFEDLLNQKIIKDGPDIPDDPKQLPLNPVEQFPKLTELKSRIADPQLQALSSLISFGTESREYSRVISTAQLFNRTMNRIYSRYREKPRDSHLFYDDRAHSSTLARAMRLSETSRNLFSLLAQAVCLEPGAHHGYLRLVDVDHWQLEHDMLLSVCGTPNWWQQLYFRLAEEKAQLGVMVVNSMCAELKKSRRLLKPSRLVAHGDVVYTMDSKSDRFQRGAQPSPSRVTLKDILKQEESERQQSRSNYRTLKHNKKRQLAVKIATASLHLYDNQFLSPPLWTPDAIYISHDNAVEPDTDPEAYISFHLSSKSAVPSLTRDSQQTDDGNPSLLALIALLLELEIEREIVPSDEDIDELSGEPSLYMALIRHHDDLQDNVDAIFYTIIDNCLDLYADSNGADSRQVRTELFTKLVMPLKERYETLMNIRPQSRSEKDRVGSVGVKAGQDIDHTYRGTRSHLEVIVETPGKDAEEPSVESLNGRPVLTDALCASLPQLLGEKILNGWTWLRQIDQTNRLMDTICTNYPTRSKVRIAVLDTGCDVNADCIVNLSDGEARLVGHWKDWAGDSKHPTDEDPRQHGTSVAAVALRVARHAEVFVGRIARDEADLQGATANIAEAISYAATTWDVDIVSMSFGFSGRDRVVEKAISRAITQRKEAGRDILFFAAANNDGLNSEEMFPASDANVISVRGTDHSGAFVQKYNPNPWANKRNHPRFGTLAENVPYDCADKHSLRSGCSLATPILAGLAAMVVQYVESLGDDGLKHGVRTRDGIVQVMDSMADTSSGVLGCKYVAPWKFFGRTNKGRIALIRSALDQLQPGH